MKPAKRVQDGISIESETKDFRVWCEFCCIRIAPHEERITASDKSYHTRCHSKHLAGTAAQKASS